MSVKPEKEILEAMRRNPDNWKGIFYYNPKDLAIIVPKLNPALGWTLNFASYYTYLAILAIVLIAFLSTYL